MREAQENTCCFTGYRPYRFDFQPEGLRPEQVQEALAIQIRRLFEGGCTRFITGMCLGVDLWAAREVLRLRQERPEVSLTAAIPFEGQENRWTMAQQQEYRRIREQCSEEVVLFSPREASRNAAACYRGRNCWMVEQAGTVLAVFSFEAADTRSGTASTVRYARRKLRRVVYIHPRTLAVSEETVRQLELPTL